MEVQAEAPVIELIPLAPVTILATDRKRAKPQIPGGLNREHPRQSATLFC